MRKLDGVTRLRELAEAFRNERAYLNQRLMRLEDELYRLSVELRKGVKR